VSYAVAGSAVVVNMKGDVVKEFRIGLTNVCPLWPFVLKRLRIYCRVSQVERDIVKKRLKKRLLRVCDPCLLNLRVTKEYKAHHGKLYARRSIIQAYSKSEGVTWLSKQFHLQLSRQAVDVLVEPREIFGFIRLRENLKPLTGAHIGL